MKKDKKMFILIQAVLGLLVILLVVVMLREQGGKEQYQVSVIVENSDDNQWSAFKYGLKMAAEDRGAEMFMVSTGAALTPEEEKRLIEQEVKNGADAVIAEPVPGTDPAKLLKEVQGKIPVMLVGGELPKSEKRRGFPVVRADDYAMGQALAEELLKDYDGKLNGKSLGIIGRRGDSQSIRNREEGFTEVLKETGVEILWSGMKNPEENIKAFLESQPKVDFVIAFDDDSLTAAGECGEANNLHGALVYGIGNSTEAVYYLDVGAAECVVVPDAFYAGYQSLTGLMNGMENSFRNYKEPQISYTVMRRENLFSKENQDILFTMSQ